MEFPKFLRIAVLPLRHIIELNNTDAENPKLSGGLEAAIIELLSKLLGFEYKLFPAKDKEWGRLTDNGTWTGVVGMVSRNESDIGFGYMTVTTNRSEAVDFIPYSIEENTFAIQKPPMVSTAESLIHPFQWEIWLSCLLILITMPIVFRILMRKTISLQKLAFRMMGCNVQQAVTIPVDHTRDRFLMGSWFAYSTFLSISYTTVLLSSLTVPLREQGVRTVKQLATAISERRFRCQANRGNVGVSLLKGSVNEDLRLIGNSVIEKDWITKDKTVKLPKNIEKFVALLGPRYYFHLEYGEEPFTENYFFEETISSWNVGVAVNKNFCCKEKLAKLLRRFMENGIFTKLYHRALFETRLSLMSEENLPSSLIVLTLNDLIGVFALLGFGILLAFIALLFERVSRT
ncbi:glutamate receptor ionotropic, delta-2-like [Argiope bruennichi]|uniref:Glutamate receptor ionotropic like protein n=1 Tax=Argiope bruennichi TaxID=94029 RepID=A0A8T0E286_ARGBR|nr:glutamate receptor ionotropic, delta-2-like [Argiope bruennichi]KAF8764466.1 Glutamate receptor ionotropic like protein [Argiope bruennichi]